MIEIRNAAGDTLQLEPGQRLTIEQASTLMADDDLPGSFSYPISFPLSDNNRRFLAYSYRPTSLSVAMELPRVQVTLEGHLYRSCTLTYRINDGQGDGYLKIDSGEVAEALKKMTLAEAIPDDLDLGLGISLTSGAAVPAAMKLYATLEPGREPFTFFPIRNDSFMEPLTEFGSSKLAGYAPRTYLNHYRPVGSQATFQVDEPGKLGYHAVPQFYLLWVLGRIMRNLGYRLGGDWPATEEAQRLTILNNTALVSASKSGQPFRVKAGLHLPEMAVSDFLKAIRQRLGLVVLFNPNTGVCALHSFSALSKTSRLVDWSPYQFSQYGIDAANLQGFKVLDFVDEKDQLYQDSKGNILPPTPQIVGRGGQEIQLKVGATKMVREASSFQPYSWSVPHVSTPGNLIDALYKDSIRYWQDSKRRNLPALRLVSYRGFVPDTGDNLYPMGSSEALTTELARIGNATALDGRFGLWALALKRYYYFRNNTRPVTGRVLLPVAELSQFSLANRVGLRLEDGILGSYLVQKIQFEAPATTDGRVLCRLQLQTLPPMPDDTDDVGYTAPENSAVWVQLVQDPGPATTDNSNAYTTYRQGVGLTLKFYSDSALTTLATVDKLTVLIQIDTYSPTAGSSTGTMSVKASGSSFLVDADADVYVKVVTNNSGEVTQDDTITYRLSAGPGYNAA